jgi:N-acetylglucosaminyl-diphospho-decaprenol L-rhamnosyltransferase
VHKLTISILVHDDFSYIANALKKIQQFTRLESLIYIVINKGAPEEIEALRKSFPNLEFIINKDPQGFGANHNMVMRIAQTPYIALLNDDIDLHDDALDALVNYLEQHANVGIVAPQLLYENGTPQVTAYSEPSLLRMIYKISGLGRLTHQQSTLRKWLIQFGASRIFKATSLEPPSVISDVEVLKGAAIVVRMATVNDIGFIDETTKAYGEEVDWNLRMRQGGWRVVLMPEAHITHFGVGQARSELKGWQITEDRKAILNYFIKHKPRWQSILIRIFIIVFHTLQLLIAVFVSRDNIRAHFNTIKLGLFWKRPTA